MIMSCFRCGKILDSPDDSNADYIIADDTKVDEPREVFVALYNNAKTLDKAAKKQDIDDSEYDSVEVGSVAEGVGAVKFKTAVRIKSIQKTGVICPDCHKLTDQVIWGVHKNSVPAA